MSDNLTPRRSTAEAEAATASVCTQPERATILLQYCKVSADGGTDTPSHIKPAPVCAATSSQHREEDGLLCCRETIARHYLSKRDALKVRINATIIGAR